MRKQSKIYKKHNLQRARVGSRWARTHKTRAHLLHSSSAFFHRLKYLRTQQEATRPESKHLRLCVRTRGVLSHKTLRFSVPTTVFLPRRSFQPTSTHSPTPLRSWDALGCGKCFGTARAARGAETSAAHAAILMAPKGRFPFQHRKSESALTLRPKGCGWVGKNQT